MEENRYKMWLHKKIDFAILIIALALIFNFIAITKWDFDLAHWSLVIIFPHFPLVLQTAHLVDYSQKTKKLADANIKKSLLKGIRLIILLWFILAFISATIDPFVSYNAETPVILILFLLSTLILIPFFIIVSLILIVKQRLYKRRIEVLFYIVFYSILSFYGFVWIPALSYT